MLRTAFDDSVGREVDLDLGIIGHIQLRDPDKLISTSIASELLGGCIRCRCIVLLVGCSWKFQFLLDLQVLYKVSVALPIFWG